MHAGLHQSKSVLALIKGLSTEHTAVKWGLNIFHLKIECRISVSSFHLQVVFWCPSLGNRNWRWVAFNLLSVVSCLLLLSFYILPQNYFVCICYLGCAPYAGLGAVELLEKLKAGSRLEKPRYCTDWL